MKKLLMTLGVVTLSIPLVATTVSCFTNTTIINPGKDGEFETGQEWMGTGDLEALYKTKEQSVKNQKWQEVLGTDYSQQAINTYQADNLI